MRLPLPTPARARPHVLSTRPSCHPWGSPQSAGCPPSLLSSPRSFYPRGTLATFATTVQRPRFGSPFILSLQSSREPLAGPTHIPSTLACASRGSCLPPDCQPTFRSQPASSPRHTCLPFAALSFVLVLPLLCDFWSFTMNLQESGGIRPGRRSSGRAPAASLLVFLQLLPLGLLVPLEGASGTGERMSVP